MRLLLRPYSFYKLPATICSLKRPLSESSGPNYEVRKETPPYFIQKLPNELKNKMKTRCNRAASTTMAYIMGTEIGSSQP